MLFLRITFAFIFTTQCFFWAYMVWLNLLGIRIVFGTIFAIQFLVWLYSVFRFKDIIRHYQYQTAWMLVSQLAAIVVLDETFSTTIDFIYFNTSNNTYDEGLVQASGGPISTTATLLSILQITTTQFLYSSFRTIDRKKKVKYDPGIKWLEYIPSSTLQKVILYRVYGQVAQAIICVAGLNAACMVTAYFIEKKIIDYSKMKRNMEMNLALMNDNEQNEYVSSDENVEEGEDEDAPEDDNYGLANENKKLIKKDTLHVKTSLGKMFDIDYKILNTIKHLKEKIQEKLGIPVQLQRLVYKNVELNNKKTVSDYDIKKGAKLKLIEEDIVGNFLLKYPRWIIAIAFVFYSLFIYGPLFVYDDDRPAWVQTFLVGMILNDLSFPAIMMYKKDILDYVSTDLLFSSASLNSKNTMDYILILAAKRVAEGVIIATIPLSFIISFIIYKISPNYSSDGVYILKSKKRKLTKRNR